MDRAYVSMSAHEIGAASGAEILGQLAHKLPFAIEPTQRAAWEYQIGHLRTLAAELPSAHCLYGVPDTENGPTGRFDRPSERDHFCC